MIKHGDLERICHVQVIDGYRRAWHRGFRRTPMYRTVHVGFIREYSMDSTGTTVTVEDAIQRLLLQQSELIEEIDTARERILRLLKTVDEEIKTADEISERVSEDLEKYEDENGAARDTLRRAGLL